MTKRTIVQTPLGGRTSGPRVLSREIRAKINTLLWAMLVMCLLGCTGNPSYADYMETTKHGLTAVPHVQEIVAIFTNAPKSHFIEQLGIQPGCARKPAKWNTVVWFDGRYEFTYQVDVIPDYYEHRVKRIKGGRFILEEVAETTNQGRGASFDASGNRKFGEAEWERIVAAKGDFAVLGIMLKTNSPVKGFDTYINANQENTWSIKETPGHNPNSPGR